MKLACVSLNSNVNIKKYFSPVYFAWAFLSPSIILLINPIPLSKVIAFYALFGVIWPITFVVFPAFFISITENNTGLEIFGLTLDFLALPLFFVAWFGPVVHLIVAFRFHKKHIENIEDKSLGWLTYLSGFI